MELLDLPLELLQIIIEMLVNTTTQLGSFRLRGVNRFFAQQVEREYMKSRYPLIPESPLTYGKNRPSEAEVFSSIRNGLLTPRLLKHQLLKPMVNLYPLCITLRDSVAALMNTPELQFPDITGDAAVESTGFLEDHSDLPSQTRFIRIVEFLTAALIYSEGLKGILDVLDEHERYFDLYRSCVHEPLEWATATAVFMEDLPTAKALLPVWARIKPDEGPELEVEYQGEEEGDVDLMSLGRYHMANVLFLAIKKDSYEMVSLVLENKADVNADRRKQPYERALEVACERGSLRLVMLILNPRWILDDGYSYKDHSYYRYLRAIRCAARCRCCHGGTQECDERISIFKLLTNRRDIADIQDLKRGVLAKTCAWGCPNITRMMLDAGADPNAKDEEPIVRGYFTRGTYSPPALVHAASHGHVELMEYLLERGAQPLSIFFPPNRVRFNEEAANPDMMTYLSDRDATIMKCGPLEQAKADFILKIASIKNCPKVVKLLIRAGFDLRAENRVAQALQDAISNASADVVEVLRSH